MVNALLRFTRCDYIVKINFYFIIKIMDTEPFQINTDINFDNTIIHHKLPDKILAGYFDAAQNGYNSQLYICDALNHGYNTIIYSFASVKGTNATLSPIDETVDLLKEQINAIHDKASTALVAFGGELNTFNPSGDYKKIAHNIYNNIIKECGFDGIDLNLEAVTTDSSNLLTMIKELRSIDPDIIITGSPQIASDIYGKASLAPNVLWNKEFLEKARLDAVFVQEYNQHLGAKFDHKTGEDKGFITASFDPLTKYVPQGTRIVVGEPANERAGSGLHNPQDIIDDLKSGDVLTNKQFSGIMTWSINHDHDENNWSWIDGVHHGLEEVGWLGSDLYFC